MVHISKAEVPQNLCPTITEPNFKQLNFHTQINRVLIEILGDIAGGIAM